MLRAQPLFDRLQRRSSAAPPIPCRAATMGFAESSRTAPHPIPRNLPLGILDLTEYEQFDVELEPGDCLLSYTDALIESRDADGEMLGEEGLLRIMRLLGDVAPHKLIETLLMEIAGRYPDNLSEDDGPVLVVRANGRKPRYSFGEKLGALVRFGGSFIRAINPRAERPPFPDANLANIGGAIIPALGRRWRSAGGLHPRMSPWRERGEE